MSRLIKMCAMSRKWLICLVWLFPLSMMAQDSLVIERKQQSFPTQIPAGNYSGITYLGNEQYAVVSDKSDTDGFFLFQISLDSISGKIVHVSNEGFFSSGQPNRDQEGIAYVPQSNSVFVSGEKDRRIREYSLDGTWTGRELQIPELFQSCSTAYGFEALTYQSTTHRFWTTTESTLPQDGEQAVAGSNVQNILRLQSFDDDLQPQEQYLYQMDAPQAPAEAANYAMGLSGMCALDDGRLILLEREFFVAPGKLGSFVHCKLYIVNPSATAADCLLEKRLLLEFRTHLSLLGRGLANYEGICTGPRLADGSRTLLLICDSQNRYGGVLKDWFKVIVLK